MLALLVQGIRPRSRKQRRLLLLCVLRKHVRGTQSDRSKRRNIAGAGQHKLFSLAPQGYPLIWAVKKKKVNENGELMASLSWESQIPDDFGMRMLFSRVNAPKTGYQRAWQNSATSNLFLP